MQSHSKDIERWYPHVTVAAIIEQEDRYLLVRENLNPPVLNQPAGHLEQNESLLQAIEREVLEETAHIFKPEFLVGVYRWTDPLKQTFLRFCFSGNIVEVTSNKLDPDILEAIWLDRKSIGRDKVRSPLVIQCIEDYCSGQKHDLSILKEMI